MDYELRIKLYNEKLHNMIKLRDMVTAHLNEQDTPLNRLALSMAEHHVERCANSCNLS